MAKQKTITIETSSLLILRARSSGRAWCAQCAAEGEMVMLGNAGVVSNLDQQALKERLNSGELHESQSADGSRMVCVNSLLALVQNRRPDDRHALAKTKETK
jgi:hypothetical protein